MIIRIGNFIKLTERGLEVHGVWSANNCRCKLCSHIDGWYKPMSLLGDIGSVIKVLGTDGTIAARFPVPELKGEPRELLILNEDEYEVYSTRRESFSA